MLNHYSESGFYNAAVIKGLIGCLFLVCTSLNFPAFSHLQKYVVCKIPDALYSQEEIPSIFLSKIAIFDVRDLIFTSLALYYFRIFERRFGSYKFFNFLIHSLAISTTVEILLSFGINFIDSNIKSIIVPSGPYGLIFSLFVYYFLDIPRVTQANILGIPITGKTLTYILGLQMCSSLPSLLSAFSGVVAGLTYRYNLLGCQTIKWIPECLSTFTSRFIKPLLESSLPEDGPVGATLEIQRQEQIELWEQQLMNRNLQVNDGIGGRMVRNLMGDNTRNLNQTGVRTPPPAEDQIMTLVEMGFDRGRVVEALRSTNNDVNAASLVLLHQT